MRATILLFALASSLLAAACATDGPYVWVDDLSDNELKPPPYRVQLGDRLAVNVWNQPSLSGEVLVRPDGNITLPLVGDIYALRLTPPEVAVQVAKKLTGLVVDPNVSVSLASNREATVSVVGEVRAAGSYSLRPGEGVIDIIARAGGLSEFANKGRIFVLRRTESLRVRFSYEKLSRADSSATKFALQDGDVVIVD